MYLDNCLINNECSILSINTYIFIDNEDVASSLINVDSYNATVTVYFTFTGQSPSKEDSQQQD